MNTKELIDLEKSVLLQTYSRPDFVIDHGQGCYLYDSEGNAYLDFVAGIAVNALGYGDSDLIAALAQQAAKLWHCSNLFYTEPQVLLARRLVELTFADRVFFSNTGTEAVEGAIKIARKWGHHHKGESAWEIVAFDHSFHGRTYGSLSATGQPKFQQDFGPMLPGFRFARFNDIASLREQMTSQTCAVLIEPIQGEGGIYSADREFMSSVYELCQQNHCLLLLDEIQCGLSRTGSFLAHEYYGIRPDIVVLAKPLAGGLPLGAILMNEDVAQVMQVGNHGTTFGGGPLTCSVAQVVIDKISRPAFIAHVREMGYYLLQQLQELQSRNSALTAVRGRGLMIGVDVAIETKTMLKACQSRGLLLCRAGEQTLRFLPPLVVTRQEIDRAIEIFASALSATSSGRA
ncbi:MAG TPA: aspartate aminotransferase family protein [bacterium]|nr:aspartate aminotransferase family protein [bacterium]HPG44194.1 aspartate aminotransferase family protein [bacterium]HPM96561.1 aspartate aminotransferase family protein [bacterium]